MSDKNRLTLHPRWDILKHEWDYTTNSKLPEEYSYASHEVVNWLCYKSECRHPWPTRISKRTRKDNPTNCPACGGKEVTDKNRLTLHPQWVILEPQWDYATNLKLPEKYSYGSEDIVNWLCDKPDCKHPWSARIYHRTRKENPTGCPACSGHEVTDKNRLTLHTRWDILKHEWDYATNFKSPEEYSYASNNMVNWLCNKSECGHPWSARIVNRTNIKQSTDCPKCSQKKGIYGELWGKFENLVERTTQLGFSNWKRQFSIRSAHSQPDIVVMFDSNSEIIEGTTEYFDLIIDAKQSPFGRRVRDCLGKYPQLCDLLLVVHYYGERTMNKHPHLETGILHNVEFMTFPVFLAFVIARKKENAQLTSDDLETITELEADYAALLKEFPLSENLQENADEDI
ncbi:MAG: zinc-ribbon domain-containing protein [Promethearchaeota archaeon]